MTCNNAVDVLTALHTKTGMKSIEEVALPRVRWFIGTEVEKYLLVLADFLGLLFAMRLTEAFALELRSEVSLPMLGHLPFTLTAGEATLLLLSLLTVARFWLKGHYSKRQPFWSEAKDILRIVTLAVLVGTASALFAHWSISLTAFFLFWLLASISIVLFRTAIKCLLTFCGGWTRPMVIVGWGENLVETARAFEDESLMGFRTMAFLIPPGKEKPAFEFRSKRFDGESVPCIRLSENTGNLLQRLGDPHVVLALEQGGLAEYQEMVQKLSLACKDLQIVPSLRGLPLYGLEVSHFFSHEVLLLSVRNNLARRGPGFVKRAFDVVVSLALLLIASPLLLWIALKVSSTGRQIIYGHRRVGRHGKSFDCYKFRTMQPNSAELLKELLERDPEARAEWERDFKLKNDPRITSIGHLLRKTSLDELPQLWNVLRGDMSLVGPRPVVDAELERYGSQVDHYLATRPGITGLWQISGRNDISYETRVYLDSWYVKNWSFFNDIVIMLRTVKVILNRDGAY